MANHDIFMELDSESPPEVSPSSSPESMRDDGEAHERWIQGNLALGNVQQNLENQLLATSFDALQDEVLKQNHDMGPQFLAEVLSVPRVTLAALRAGHRADFSFDLTYNGWDALKPAMRAQLKELIRLMGPRVLVLSPPCTMFSPLMRQWFTNN